MNKNTIREPEVLLSFGLDPEKYKLGKVCIRHHITTHNGFDYTVREVKTSRCPKCHNLKSKESREKVPIEIRRQRGREFYFKHQEKRKEEHKRWLKNNPEKASELRKKRRLANLEEERAYSREYCKKYIQTEHGKMVRKKAENKRRALKKSSAIPYSTEELKSRYALFENTCAYCGKAAQTTDHFIALANGGRDAIFNLLPCCRSCNSSKRHSHPESWYKAQPFYQESRWAKILLACY